MRIILNTDKKTVAAPWIYAVKQDELNRIIADGGGNRKNDFKAYRRLRCLPVKSFYTFYKRDREVTSYGL